MTSRYNLRQNPQQTGPTNGQMATSAVDELTRQRQQQRQERIAVLQSKKANNTITPNEDSELNSITSGIEQINMNRGGRRRRRTNKRRRTFRRKRSTKRRR
jgi:hypothetical protein